MSFSSGQTKPPVIYGCPIKWVSVDHRVGYHCINKLLFATNFMYWKTKWFSTSLGCTILLITQCAINSLPLGRSVTQWKLCSSWRPILDCALWVFLAGFFHCKILLETSILRVKTPNRAWGAVFKVQGPVTTYIEVVRGEEHFFAVPSLWLFRTVRLLNRLWVIVEQSLVYKFQAAEKYLSPALRDCTCWIHH